MNRQYIISGYVAGQKFRPSNWTERLCEAGATLDPIKRIMRYSNHLHPRQCDEYGSSVYVNFAGLDTELAGFVREFVSSNNMDMIAIKSAITLEVINEQAIQQPSVPASFDNTPKSLPRAA